MAPVTRSWPDGWAARAENSWPKGLELANSIEPKLAMFAEEPRGEFISGVEVGVCVVGVVFSDELATFICPGELPTFTRI
ncbi:hypothetical protein BpHYR1_017864 [Brachionus plicatilis]|uniref:Uncharacterized protein n=1 Tax=Brachionus plicatilis TaxID=10195 RepID=A0A3M7QYQ5_BRAPC|nr:hypothetical protein BpHYR1_017864 [Brachionus plicatilis]